MYLSRSVSALGKSAAARTPVKASARPILRWKRSKLRFIVIYTSRFLFLDPLHGGVESGVFACEELPPGEWDFFVGNGADPLQRFAALRNVVGDGVLEAISVGQPFDDGGQRGGRGPCAEEAGSVEVFQSARQDLRRGSGAAVHQHGQRSPKRLRAGEDYEFDGEAAQVLGAQLKAGLIGKPSGDPHGQTTDTARIAAHVDYEAPAVPASFDGLFHGLGEPFGIEEDVEPHVSDIPRQPAPFAPGGQRGHIAQAHDLAAGRCAVKADGDLAAGAVQKFHGDGGTDAALEARQHGAAQVEVEQGRVLELRLDSRQHRRDCSVPNAQNFPPGLDAFGGRRRSVIQLRYDSVTLQDAQVDAGVGFAGVLLRLVRGSIQVVVDVCGKDAKVRLLQPSQHVVEDFANLIRGLGGFHLGAQFVVHRLPVQAAELGIPVFVANRGPYLFEGLDVGAALRGRHGLAGGGDRAGDGQREYLGAVQHALNYSLLVSTTPLTWNRAGGAQIRHTLRPAAARICRHRRDGQYYCVTNGLRPCGAAWRAAA